MVVTGDAAWIERMNIIICLGMMFRYLDDEFIGLTVFAAWIKRMDTIICLGMMYR